MSRLCGLLALYDQLCRAPSKYLEAHPLIVAGHGAGLADLLALVDDRLPSDVAAMTELFVRAQPQLHGAATWRAFDRSLDLGRADADLIVDGTLVELKTVKTPALNKRTVWQLLGYLLADTTDRHRIREVRWYFPRQGYGWGFPFEEFLCRLRGDAVGLAEARTRFAGLFPPTPPSTLEATWASWIAPTTERPVSFFPAASGRRGRWHVAQAQVVGGQAWGAPPVRHAGRGPCSTSPPSRSGRTWVSPGAKTAGSAVTASTSPGSTGVTSSMRAAACPAEKHHRPSVPDLRSVG